MSQRCRRTIALGFAHRPLGDQQGFLKQLFHRDDLRLLGVHVVGEQATEVVHLGLLALTLGATADLFREICFNYPTALIALSQIRHSID